MIKKSPSLRWWAVCVAQMVYNSALALTSQVHRALWSSIEVDSESPRPYHTTDQVLGSPEYIKYFEMPMGYHFPVFQFL